MITVIVVSGTSLLTNDISKRIFTRNFHDDFKACLKSHDSLRQGDMQAIISNIRDNAGDSLAHYLLNQVLPNSSYSASAETSSVNLLIQHLIETEHKKRAEIAAESRLHIVHSNTVVGRACAFAIREFFMKKLELAKERVIPSDINKLDGTEDNFEAGKKQFTDELALIIAEEQKERDNRVILNATGGFKPEAAFATVCGLLNDVEVMYTHEVMKEVIWMPRLPLGSRFELWYLNSTQVELALQGTRNSYDSLPPDIKGLMEWDQQNDKAVFKHMGQMLWDAYRKAASEQRLPGTRHSMVHMLQGKKFQVLGDRIATHINQWNHIWEGHLFGWAVDHTQAHCENLRLLAEQLLSRMNTLLKPCEIYVLIACIWLHDIGYSESSEITDDGTKKNLLPGDIWTRHSELTYQLLERDYQSYGFKEWKGEAQIIATICKYHGKITRLDDSELTSQTILTVKDDAGNQVISEDIDPQLIAAMLRLIDSCDMGIRRAGDEKYVEARRKALPREMDFYRIPEVCAFLNKLKKVRDLFNMHPGLDTELNALAASTGQLNEWMTRSLRYFEDHLRIDHAEIHAEQAAGHGLIQIVIHPRPGVDVNEARQVVKDNIKIDGDLDPIKEFLEPRSIRIDWKIKEGAGK